MTGAAQGSQAGTRSDLWAGSGLAWVSLSSGSDLKEGIVGNCPPLLFPHLEYKHKVGTGKFGRAHSVRCKRRLLQYHISLLTLEQVKGWVPLLRFPIAVALQKPGAVV